MFNDLPTNNRNSVRPNSVSVLNFSSPLFFSFPLCFLPFLTREEINHTTLRHTHAHTHTHTERQKQAERRRKRERKREGEGAFSQSFIHFGVVSFIFVSQNGTVKLGGLDDNIKNLSPIKNLLLSACGTSYYAALYGTSLMK